MAVYSTILDVSAIAAYIPTTPSVVIPFTPTSITVVNLDTADVVAVSLDGTNDAARLFPGTPCQGMTWKQRVQSVWLHVVGVPVGTTNVQIMAED